jgi:hypothetical protein
MGSVHGCFGLSLVALALAVVGFPQGARAADGQTQVARWQDDKKAAFMLMFDDSCMSHAKNVIPELKKRGLVGTFYINPGGGHFKANQKAWETEFPAMGMVYANHTFTHKGAFDVAMFDDELTKCDEEIAKCFPNLKTPRLVSFGQPGVKKEDWRISKEELQTLLDKHHLIMRPTFDQHGANIQFKSGADLVKLVDKAVANGSVEYVIFHGVGGDWISMTMADFNQLLDALIAKKDQVWVTDHISAHQYATERDGAEVKVVEAGAKQVRVALTSKADPKFYDLPLTLVTQVPAVWKQCQVTQGARKATVPVTDGVARYAAVPGTDEITLTSE